MPASDTGGTQTPAEARAIVEPLGLDAGSLGDGDYSALTLQHSSGQYTNSELETLVNFQAELDRLQAVDGSLGGDELGTAGGDVIVTSEETVESFVEIDGTTHEVPEELILPDITDDTLLHSMGKIENVALTTTVPVPIRRTITSRPMTIASKSPQGQAIVLIQSPTASSSVSSPSSVTLSGGQIVSKLTSVSSNLTSLTHSFVTTKSADGKIVQLRPAGVKSITTAGGSTTIPGFRPLQAAVKRPAPSTPGSVRNVYAKVIITGNQSGGQQAQPIMLSTSQSQAQALSCGQPLKLISGTGHQTIMSSPTRAITFAQAQQMGLISPSKLQQILPSSSNKQGGIVVNKIVSGSPIKTAPKITMMQPSTLKSPTKILPAPVSSVAQLKPASSTVTVTAITTGGTTVLTPGTSKPLLSPNKVIIRQGLKPGTMLSSIGTSQVIRIPSSHNLTTGTNVAQIQVQGGKGVQYVRVMNPGNTSSLNKPRMVTMSSVSSNLKPVTIRASSQPLQQQTVKMVPIAPATSGVRTVVPKSLSGQRILIPAGVTQQNHMRGVAANHIRAVAAKSILPATPSNVTYMVPAQYVQQVRNQVLQGQAVPSSQPTSLLSASASTPSTATEASGSSVSTPPDALPLSPPRPPQPARTSVEPNGIRPRKPCNCTKSQCLKLYCDCFANGEFCYMCNCNNCFNNLQHEEDRQGAIKSCLERNPNAFRPKIGKGHMSDERRHNKGCNCKRSGCLKNYCECYEAKIPCSNNCKCVGCRNLEESDTLRSTLRDLADVAESRVLQQIIKKENLTPNIDKTSRPFVPTPQANFKQPFSFMTQAVVKATVECMLASAEDAEMNNLSDDVSERLLIEELGRCLVEVIRCSDKADAASSDSGKAAATGGNAAT